MLVASISSLSDITFRKGEPANLPHSLPVRIEAAWCCLGSRHHFGSSCSMICELPPIPKWSLLPGWYHMSYGKISCFFPKATFRKYRLSCDREESIVRPSVLGSRLKTCRNSAGWEAEHCVPHREWVGLGNGGLGLG